LGRRATIRPDARGISLTAIDPTGIDFVEPAGIAYLDDENSTEDDTPMLADFADDKPNADNG
jgi:hypothetical protein